MRDNQFARHGETRTISEEDLLPCHVTQLMEQFDATVASMATQEIRPPDPPPHSPPPHPNQTRVDVFDPVGSATAPTQNPRPLSVSKSRVSQGLSALTPDRLAVPGLSRFTNKRQRSSTPATEAQDLAEDVSRTPKSTRMANLFPEGHTNTSLEDLINKLLGTMNAAFQLGDKRANTKSITIGIETAADLLVLAGAVYDTNQIDSTRANLQHSGLIQFENASRHPPAPPGQDGSVKDQLKVLTEQVQQLASVVQLRNKNNPQQQHSPAGPQANSYALAASKHAPKSNATKKQKPPQRRIITTKRKRAPNTILLNQIDARKPDLAEKPLAEIIRDLNLQLRMRKIKLKEEDAHTISVKAVQRLPSNDLVIHLISEAHADRLRAQEDEWLPFLSSKLKIKVEEIAILVHGIPRSFNANIKDHLDELLESNPGLKDDYVSIRWLKPEALDDPNKCHLTLHITLHERDLVQKWTREKVWFRDGLKLSMVGGAPPLRCYNCCEKGHTAHACMKDPLCPYCGNTHKAHVCPKKVMTPPKIAQSAPPFNPSSSPKIIITLDDERDKAMLEDDKDAETAEVARFMTPPSC
ncbi:hypothetical protein CROQUDRAFT_99108 [Cronartium quercuum f. sp. fusiforme G11]|uniref:CCHC-type domain-containing protein n=1 Tax=Cronartium quercuum f. sp. fusiforme G11 TaxID=708437 RepID=A0A9P6T872_9BASI|nr:hypothetical protein CROQUDRAFT_99108 [Cronartium quercuum f. sp. fusiforme G11]